MYFSDYVGQLMYFYLVNLAIFIDESVKIKEEQFFQYFMLSDIIFFERTKYTFFFSSSEEPNMS